MSEHIENIIAYVSGELTSTESKQFEERLKADKDLNEEYQLYLKSSEYIRARKMLEEIEQDPDLPGTEAQVKEYFAKTGEKKSGTDSLQPDDSVKDPGKLKSTSVPIRRILYWAVPAALIIGAILIIRSFMTTDPNIKLYEKYYQPLSSQVLELGLVRGESEATVKAGLDCYIKSDYKCAIEKFDGNPAALFYLGLAHLGAGNFNTALEAFHLFEQDNPTHMGVKWYLGLTCLRMNDLDQAISRLEDLQGTSSPYFSKADKLLEQIKKVRD